LTPILLPCRINLKEDNMEEDLFEDEKERKTSAKREQPAVVADEAPDAFAEDGTAKDPSDSKEEEKNLDAIQIDAAIEEVFKDYDETEGVDDDDENWIPLDDEEDPDILAEDDDIDDHEELEAIDLEDVLEEDDDEADIDIRKEDEKIDPEDNIEGDNEDEIDIDDILEDFEDPEEKKASAEGDGKAWIPPDDTDDLETKEEADSIGVEERLEHDIAEDEDEADISMEEEELDLEKIIEEEGLDISNGIENNAEDAEAPPWEEEIEIPLHGTTEIPKKKNTILVAFIFFLVALTGIGLYGFYKFKIISEKQNPIIKGEEQASSFVTEKILSGGKNTTAPVKKAEDKAQADRQQMAENAAPAISGEPLTEAHEGVPYSFFPKANDADPSNKLTFFIANQPVWTSFDISTGALTGTPDNGDVGTYKRIAILVTDGRATASLPAFDLTVTGAAEVQKKNEEGEQIAPIAEKKIAAKPVASTDPVKEKTSMAETDPYLLPDLSDLIKQMEFRDAAIEYHKIVRHVPQAYSLKLEVDCVEKSVQMAYQACNFDPRMFILPREVNGRDCFIVFWGLYATKNEALKALSSIPAFFKNQGVKPTLIILKQYL